MLVIDMIKNKFYEANHKKIQSIIDDYEKQGIQIDYSYDDDDTSITLKERKNTISDYYDPLWGYRR